jgi:hypothetical protein
VFVLATLIYEWAVGAIRSSPFRLDPRSGAGRHALHRSSHRAWQSGGPDPAVVLISAAAMQRRRPGAWLGALLLTLLLALPWYLAWRWLAGGDPRSQDYLFLFLPAISLIGLYWTRWWFLRPTRTWLDEIRAAGG